MARAACACALALFQAAVAPSAADEAKLPAPLADARRVVFLGDSITYAGTYVDFVEVAIRLRDPSWQGEIVDVGLPSETVSGLSEPGHAGGAFPRPDLRERLDRVLAQLRPDLIVACYGMNDGIYQPFAEERFAAFREGIARLRSSASRAGAPVVHLTPPVFDPQPIRSGGAPAGRDAGAGPYAGYDEVLERYAGWLLARRAEGWSVVDVHGAMKAELAARRAAEPGFAFAKDGVHPDRPGHAVIARALLLAWGWTAEDANEPLLRAGEPETELLSLVRSRRRLLSDAWLTATGHQRPGMAAGLPLPEAQARAAALLARMLPLLSAAR